MRRAVLAAAAVLAAGPAPAAPPARAELLAKAAEAADACARHMPDAIATTRAMQAAGLQLKEADGSYRYFGSDGYRVVAGISTAGGRNNGCLVSVNGMTPAQAESLIQPWLSASSAQPAQPDRRGIDKMWIGSFKGGPIRLALVNHFELGLMRGAAIIAGAPKRQEP